MSENKLSVIKNAISIDDIMIGAINVPGVKVDRNDFLRKSLTNHFSQEQIDIAIKQTPAKAGITVVN